MIGEVAFGRAVCPTTLAGRLSAARKLICARATLWGSRKQEHNQRARFRFLCFMNAGYGERAAGICVHGTVSRVSHEVLSWT